MSVRGCNTAPWIPYKTGDRLIFCHQKDRNLQDEDIETCQQFSIYPDYKTSYWKGKNPKISACYIRCSSGSSKFRIFFIVFITSSGRLGRPQWNTFPSSHKWRSFMVFGKKSILYHSVLRSKNHTSANMKFDFVAVVSSSLANVTRII